MLHTPPWVRYFDAGRLTFLWDDTAGGAETPGMGLGSDTQVAPVLRTAMRIAPRARLALAVALTEWIVWRFEGLHARPEPGAILEAAWCATGDTRYLRPFDLPAAQWRGPVEGPLRRAFQHLRQILAVGHEDPLALYDTLGALTRLATHVQPTTGPLLAWLPLVLDRLALVYPAGTRGVQPGHGPRGHAADPAAALGPWIARDVFDLAIPVDGNTGRAFLQQTLSTARREENPFLAVLPAGQGEHANARGAGPVDSADVAGTAPWPGGTLADAALGAYKARAA